MRKKIKSIIVYFLFIYSSLLFSQEVVNPIKISDVSLKTVLSIIEENSNKRFIYSDDLIDQYKSAKFNIVANSIDEIIKYLANKTDLTFQYLENNLIVINFKNKIKGVVLSVDGESLVGVNIIELGTNNGTVTNLEGEFELLVTSKKNALQFSFIGYKTKLIEISDNTEINVFLEKDVQLLNEIIVVGYGEQKKRVVTGSISSINAHQLKKIPVPSFDQSIQGRLSGVYVSQNSNAPGGAVTVRVRGVISTTGGNEPLYIVDGMPISNENLKIYIESGGEMIGTMNNLNPYDIESIEVLKDASAAAIYGSRAAAGVILITTKKGKPGRTKFHFNSYYGIQKASKIIKLTNSQQFVELRNQALINDSSDILPNYNDPSIFQESTNWQEEIFQIAPVQNYNLSITGGNNSSRFFMSTNYFNQKGIVIGSSFNRYSFRLNSDHSISKKIKIGNNLSISRTEDDFIHTKDIYHGVLNATLGFSPLSKVYDLNGEYASSTGPYMYDYDNPVTMALEREQYLNTNKIFGNIYLEYNITPTITYRISSGIDAAYSRQRDFRPENMPGLLNSSSSLTEIRTENINWLVDNILLYKKLINKKHNFSILVGASNEEFRRNSLLASSEIIRNDFPLYMEGFIDLNADTRSSYGEWSEPVGYLSAFSRITYDYLSKYMLTANFRRDGSTKFGKDKKFGNFPSISLGWNIAKENFMQGTKKLANDIKLRIGYGYVGNSSIRDNQYISTLATTAYSFNNKSTPGYYPASIANPDLHWEASKQINYGVDINFFDNIILFTADYYIKSTKDMLVEIPLAGYLGIDQNYTVNEGEMKNSGYEFDITIRNSIREFSFEFNSFISFLNNEVTKIVKGERYLEYDYTRTQVGYPVGAFYGWKMDKIFQTQEEIDNLNKKEQKYDELGNPVYDNEGNPVYNYTYFQDKKTAPGDIKFKDIASINKEGEVIPIPDGIVDEADKTIIGNPIPDITYGLIASLYFKNFSLDLICDGVYGNELINVTRINSESMTLRSNYTKYVYDNYWHGEETSNKVPRPIISDPNDNARISDRWIEDGSYFRLTNIQFGYQLPYRIINRLKIYQFKIYISLKNLYTYSNYSGYDPDIGAYQRNALQAGIDYGSYPRAKAAFIGFNIDF